MSIVIFFKGLRPSLRLNNVKRMFPMEDGKVKLWLGIGSAHETVQFEDVYYIIPA